MKEDGEGESKMDGMKEDGEGEPKMDEMKGKEPAKEVDNPEKKDEAEETSTPAPDAEIPPSNSGSEIGTDSGHIADEMKNV